MEYAPSENSKGQDLTQRKWFASSLRGFAHRARTSYRSSIFFEKQARKILAELSKLEPVDDGFELIRIGPNSDGGYLIPKNLEGLSACLSAGCDQAWEFERHIDREFSIPSHIIDSEDKKAIDFGPNQHFIAGLVGTFTDKKLNRLSVQDWMDLSLENDSGDLLLQMDIEGDEWEILRSLHTELLDRFRIIVVEVHNLKVLDRRFFKYTLIPFIRTITKNFRVVHTHPNNCCPFFKIGKNAVFPEVLELTLHRKNEAPDALIVKRTTPHPLDRPNVAENPVQSIDWATINLS